MKTKPVPEQDDLVSLYRSAFKELGSRALWNVRELEDPGPQDALVIARYLRVEGNLAARRLAERIERLCRAPHQVSIANPALARRTPRPGKLCSGKHAAQP